MLSAFKEVEGLGLTVRRLMSDYEVTLVNDNSTSKISYFRTPMLEGGVKRVLILLRSVCDTYAASTLRPMQIH